MDENYNMNNQYDPNAQYNPNVQYNQNAQYNQNIQNLQNQQASQFGANTSANSGEKKEEDPAKAWQAAVGIGVVNVILAIVCGSFRIRILSVGFVIFLLGGIYCSFDAIKGGFKVKKPVSILLGIIGMVLNLAAAGYYLWSIIYTIGSKFN